MTPDQCRAARAIRSITQPKLAEAAGVGLSTVVDFEKSRRAVSADSIASIRAALEAAGVIFVEENGEGPGVRLRKQGAVVDHPKPTGPATDAVERMEAEIAADRQRRKP